jgi:LysR family transcriptional regulator, transcriptional activator for bauABCD operon
VPSTRPSQLDPSDIKLLRLFTKIVECGGFSGAQAELNVSASTISTQIATLESRLGMRLCTRGRVGFSLTDKGRRVYASARRLEEAIDEFRGGIGELRGKLVGELHVAVVDSTITNVNFHLHYTISRFAARDHSVHISLHIMEPALIEKRVLDGQVHIGIGAFYHHVPPLTYEHLCFERQGLYCGGRHPLFAVPADRIRRDQVLQADYVARGYMTQRQVPRVAGLKVAATAFDMEATLTLIRSGSYIGHLPEHYAASWVDRGELRPLLPETFGFGSDFEFVMRRGAADFGIIRAFVDDLRSSHGTTS